MECCIKLKSYWYKILSLNFMQRTISLPRWAKQFVVLIVDICICATTVWLAYYLRLSQFIPMSGAMLMVAILSMALALPIFFMAGLYRAIFRYSGWPALMSLARAVGVYGLIFVVIFTLVGVETVPRTVGIIQPLLLFLFVGASRAIAQFFLNYNHSGVTKSYTKANVLIYGAGNAGRQLLDALINSREFQVMGFLDDERKLQGHIINGQRIYNPVDIKNLVAKLKINNIFLAIPSLTQKQRNEILDNVKDAHVAVRSLPSMTDLALGKIRLSDIQDLGIDDLLGREPKLAIYSLLLSSISNKIIMVTGAGGSIGSELCRQIISLNPSRLLLVEQSEFALYAIHQEIQDKCYACGIELVPLLASVRDIERIRKIMSAWHPDTIYHAAAYKHVPLVEFNWCEGIANNVFGTLRLANAAIEYGVSDFVLISTDKAVRPTNVMGASKRLAEMVLQALSTITTSTKFCMVRFGNVLDSSGSVVPKFRQQIRDGGPITITHPEINRYFMTIPEASQLVIQAGAMASGGDVFVLDMGQPIKILDLARRMIELNGLTIRSKDNPDGDIEIIFTGLRPGEKLYEELLIGCDPISTKHPGIMMAHEEFTPWTKFNEVLNELKLKIDEYDIGAIESILKRFVFGYSPSKKNMDLFYQEHIKKELH